jgi:hypothetical protein
MRHLAAPSRFNVPQTLKHNLKSAKRGPVQARHIEPFADETRLKVGGKRAVSIIQTETSI